MGDASTLSYQNLIDNVQYGVHATNSNVTVANHVFMNMIPSLGAESSTGAFYPPYAGNGIYAVETNDVTNENRLRVYSPGIPGLDNQFYQYRAGVEVANYFQVVAEHNQMICRHSGGVGDMSGIYGITVKSAKYDTVSIRNNSITNNITGISLSATADAWAYTHPLPPPGQFIGDGIITGNIVQAHPGGTSSITTERVNNGIVLQKTVMSAIGIRHMGAMNVSGNHLFDVYHGIAVNNWSSQLSNTVYNEVRMMKWHPAGSSMPAQYGISNSNCRLSNVYLNSVGLSDIYGTNDVMRAYYSAANNGLNTFCNGESGPGRGFEFFSSNPATSWFNNTMEKNGKGMILNHAMIGDQVLGGSPMNNQWYGAWDMSNTQTFVDHSIVASNKLYVNNSTLTNPSYNAGFPITLAYVTGPSASIPVVATVPTECPALASEHKEAVDTSTIYTQVARQHVAYSEYALPQRWMSQYALWNTMVADTSLVDSSAALAQFATLATHSRYNYLTTIEQALVNGDFTTATDMLGWDIDTLANTGLDSGTQVHLADDVANDYIVNNYRAFYTMYMKYMQQELNEEDSLEIEGLAGLCPLRNGAVVYQARALYSEVFNNIRIFSDDSCAEADTSYIGERHSQQHYVSTNNTIQHYKVYPNPNDGNFVLQQSIADEAPVQLRIFDAIGQQVYEQAVIFSGGIGTIHSGGYLPGIYIIELRDSKGKVYRFKLVVQK